MAQQRNNFTYNQFKPDLKHHDPKGPGIAVCERCQAIWQDQHWAIDTARAQAMQASGVATTVCPGCTAVERQEYDGHVVLEGAFVEAHEAEILGLIRNTEDHIRSHNPIARVAEVNVGEGKIEVLTISPFLAERIGKELEKAYDGKLTLKHAEREAFIRVSWLREA